MKIDHILVTTDLSEEALRPCASIAELARMVDARITLLHVVQDLPGRPHAAPFAPPLSSPGLEKRLEEARGELEEQREAFGDVELKLDVISGDDVAAAVARYAEGFDVDVIAVSTHGRTGFRHLVLGSVAEALLRHSPVPVVVFPPAGKRGVRNE